MLEPTLLTRTKIINARADSTLNSYIEVGLEGVAFYAEYTTAKDEKVRRWKVRSSRSAKSAWAQHPDCQRAWNLGVIDPEDAALRQGPKPP